MQANNTSSTTRPALPQDVRAIIQRSVDQLEICGRLVGYCCASLARATGRSYEDVRAELAAFEASERDTLNAPAQDMDLLRAAVAATAESLEAVPVPGCAPAPAPANEAGGSVDQVFADVLARELTRYDTPAGLVHDLQLLYIQLSDRLLQYQEGGPDDRDMLYYVRELAEAIRKASEAGGGTPCGLDAETLSDALAPWGGTSEILENLKDVHMRFCEQIIMHKDAAVSDRDRAALEALNVVIDAIREAANVGVINAALSERSQILTQAGKQAENAA